jgi:hypothetical protein
MIIRDKDGHYIDDGFGIKKFCKQCKITRLFGFQNYCYLCQQGYRNNQFKENLSPKFKKYVKKNIYNKIDFTIILDEQIKKQRIRFDKELEEEQRIQEYLETKIRDEFDPLPKVVD